MKLKYPSLGVKLVKAWKPVMAAKGVSTVARSRRGFTTAFLRADGSYSSLKIKRNPANNQPWVVERRRFITRHLVQVKGNVLFDEQGCPTRHHLALIAWDYSPAPGRLAKINPNRCY